MLDILISVIVSVYNIETYIRQCVDSILAQSYNNFELLLVNDGSKDKSLNICREYELRFPSKIRVINKENGGLSSARNAGIKAAAGDYCYFVDGDDCIGIDTLSHFIEILNKYGHVDYIHGRMSYFYEDVNDRRIQPYFVDNSWSKDVITGQEMFVRAYSYQKNIQLGVRGMYNRRFLLENDILFIERHCSWPEDEEWTPRVFYYAKTCLGSSEPDYYYRENRKGSETSKLLNLNTALITLQIYRGWITLSKYNNCTNDFASVLNEKAGNRTIDCIIKYSKLEEESLEKFIVEANKHSDLIKNSHPYNFTQRVVLIVVKFFGVKRAITWLHILRKIMHR